MKVLSTLVFLLFSNICFANQFVFDVGFNSPYVRLIENNPYHPATYAGLVLEHTYSNFISVACREANPGNEKETILGVNGMLYYLVTTMSGTECANNLKRVYGALMSGDASKVVITYDNSHGAQPILQSIEASQTDHLNFLN